MTELDAMRNRRDRKEKDLNEAITKDAAAHTNILNAENRVNAYEENPSDENYEKLIKEYDEASSFAESSQANIESIRNTLERINTEIDRCTTIVNTLGLDEDNVAIAQLCLAINLNAPDTMTWTSTDTDLVNKALNMAIDDFRHRCQSMRDGTAVIISNRNEEPRFTNQTEPDAWFSIKLRPSAITTFNVNDEDTLLSCIYMMKRMKTPANLNTIINNSYHS
jgi:hypothetical protein